jgi:Zn-dependent metalloprotease
MTNARRACLAAALLGAALVATGPDATSQEPAALTVAAGHTESLDELRQWDATVDGMARTGGLVVMSRLGDASVEGHTHEYLAQHHAGIPVFGAGVSRQLDAAGVTVSLFGTLHQGIKVNLAPALSGAQAAALLEEVHGGTVAAGGQPALGVLPLPGDSYALAWLVAMSDGYFYFVDAADGALLQRVDATKQQSAVGTGADPQGTDRKLGTTQEDGRFQAHDRLRPTELVTLDVRFNSQRFQRLVFEHLISFMPPGDPIWTADDYATDADNDWDDPAVVGAHAYTGWTYDYFAARHGWEGIDGANGRTITLVNLAVANAFFSWPPFGPEGTGVFGYGRRTDETSEEPYTVLDIVGHELMHGVTHFSVSNRTGSPLGLFNLVPIGARLGPKSFTTRNGTTYTCETARFPGVVETPQGLKDGLIPAWCVDGRFLLAYSGDGAIHEGYSDIFGESLGFYYEDEGVSADYLVGGDFAEGPIRSLIDPSHSRDPDTYADRFEFALTRGGAFEWDYSGYVFVRGKYFGKLRNNAFGYGGDHWNSLILSHAFYLAIEGGTHRTSGMTVKGGGEASREEIERIFFRAMRDLMPPMASLPVAAAVIRQSAFDLAPGSEAQRAIHQALRAVGL